MANTPIGEIFKDRRVQIGTAVAAVLALAGVAFVVLKPSGEEAADTASAPPPANPGVPAGSVPGVPPVGGRRNPGNPGSPTPGRPATVRPGTPAVASAIAVQDSWAGAPAAFPGGGGTGAGAASGPGTPGVPVAGGPAPKLPRPIQYGQTASVFRGDPFLSTQKFVVDLPFAYQYTVPIRLASAVKPVVPTMDPIPPEERYGPIPRIPRRVAGVLYDGAVSAILESGTPGPEADVRVIQPGVLVPSGVPGLPDLTVAVITTTKVTLRDQYNRTIDVPLSNLPRDVGEALRQQAGQQAGQQGGQGGIPGGGFPQGGPPGGGRGFPGAPGKGSAAGGRFGGTDQ